MRNTLLPRPPRRHVWDRRRPPVQPPAPPAPPVTVLAVRLAPGEPNKAVWLFSAPVIDPPDGVSGLVANGLPGLAWSREEDSNLFVEYAEAIESGGTWENGPSPNGITGTDGQPVAEGSGVVTE